MQINLEGTWEGCHGDFWRLLEGKIIVVNGVVDSVSTFKWRLMRCPDVPALQRLRHREGNICSEIFNGTMKGGVLTLETKNVDDSTFLGYTKYEITLNTDNTFTGKSETQPEYPAKESPFTGEIDGKYEVVQA